MTIETDVGAYDYEELESADPGVRHRWARGLRLLEEIADRIKGTGTGGTAAGSPPEAAPPATPRTVGAVSDSQMIPESDDPSNTKHCPKAKIPAQSVR